MRAAPALVSAAAAGAADGVLPPWTPGVGWLAVAAGLPAGEMRIVWFRENITNAAEQDIVAAGDTVAVRYVIEATHEENLLGLAPIGRRVRWDAVDIYRLADGMIIEEWAADDATAILYQVGAYTPPWLATSGPTDADGAG